MTVPEFRSKLIEQIDSALDFPSGIQDNDRIYMKGILKWAKQTSDENIQELMDCTEYQRLEENG